MARSQFSFVIAVPDSSTKELKAVAGATAKIRYRNPDLSSGNYDNPAVEIYDSESATNPVISNGVIAPDSNGKVSGWLEDGRYSITVTSTATPAAFSPIVQNFDIRSGGEFKVAKGGVPSDPENPQIFLDDDSSGGNPSIKLGSGSAEPDIVIRRSNANELTIDAATTGSLSTVIVGDVKLSDSSKVLDVNNARIQNTASPLISTDAANKSYVDASNSSAESGSYDGRLHNLPFTTPTGTLTQANANSVYFSKVNVPLGINVSALEFTRAAGNNAVTFQFGLFAEFNAYDEVTHKMVCLAATKVESTTWNGSSAKAYELPIGIYTDVDEDEDLDFVEQPFYYGDWILQSGFTGNLYAGLVTTGNTVQPLGATITSPIISGTLGLEEERQLPLFAGITTPSSAIVLSPGVAYYKGADTTYRILGALAETSDLDSLTPAVGDAYIIDDSVWIYGTDAEWFNGADAIDFPSTRSTSIPFVRVKV